MRAILVAAVIAAGSTFALAGPSDHASLRPGDAARSARPRAGLKAPYALTGRPEQRRVLEYRDVPKGRGQSERQAFWAWKSE